MPNFKPLSAKVTELGSIEGLMIHENYKAEYL
jgi:hypothetical protein